MCGLTLLKMSMIVIMPQLVIDHRSKERDIEYLTFAKSDNYVRNYLTKMQDKRNGINTL